MNWQQLKSLALDKLVCQLLVILQLWFAHQVGGLSYGKSGESDYSLLKMQTLTTLFDS